MTPVELAYIERELGWELSESGIVRANDLLERGVSKDGVVEALSLL